MKIKCLATGSTGNCYILTARDGTSLILDCGIPIAEIKRGLDYDMTGVVGAVCTHKHLDHAKAVKSLEYMLIPVFKPYDGMKTMSMLGGCFAVRSFDLTNLSGEWMHTDTDGTPCPCYGYIITHPEMGTLVYVTDTELCKYCFKDVNHILVSCNYQKDKINLDDPKAAHVLRGHMELETVKGMVKANASPELVNVMLCHMSRENAVPEECVAEVEKVAHGANVMAMERGMEIELNNTRCPFL